MDATRTRPILLSLILALSVAAIVVARPRVAAVAARVKDRSDSYALPPARVLPAVSMGYRHALADLLWANVLVTQGLRAQEMRPFDHLADYYDAINTLDPKFREPYKYADTLFTFQAKDPDKVGSLRMARVVLERGVRELPHDAELQLNYGEFLAYVGAGNLPDPAEQERWRAEGASALIRAGQLGSKNETIMWRSVAAVGLLGEKEAERSALIHFLERVYATTEDVELREHVTRKLRALEADQARSRVIARQMAFDKYWRPLGFVSRTQLRIIGPARGAWECAGPRGSEEARDRCLRDWTAWSRSLDSEP